MKYVDEFRNGDQAREIAKKIRALVKVLKINKRQPLQFMEVCGGHTHSIFRYGLAQFLPEEIEFVHGPGCPVCVLPMGVVDDCIAIAEKENMIFTTFGDAMRVPGSKKSLLQAKAEGCDIRMVYSPLDAMQIAKQNPEKEVVFFGLGFETTMPSTALTLLQAEKEQVNNFSLFCNHITIIPTIKAMLDSPDMRLDGFLGPGHVSMIIGTRPYEFISRDYDRPLVVAGFEPLDILQSVYMLVKQIVDKRCEIENQYKRIVPRDGNQPALQAITDVFELREFFEWRGLGSIDYSGVKIRERFIQYDAEMRYDLPKLKIADPDSAQCGEVVTGVIKPEQCKLFGKSCIPDTPIGALMVSTEGACAAHYHYGRIEIPLSQIGV
jgi:hydrogenase expression/formation protein HypD